MQAEEVVTHRHEQHLGSDVFFAAREKATERVILFDHGEDALRLDRSVHPQQYSFWRDNFLVGLCALLQESFGYVNRPVRVGIL